MNIPQAIENAIRETLRKYCATSIPAAWIHCVQSGRDFENLDAEQQFPQVLVASSTKGMESGGTTFAVEIAVSAVTDFNDDPSADQRAAIFEEIEKTLDALISPCMGDQEIIEYFSERVRENVPAFSLGGLVPDQEFPDNIENAQILSYTGTLHFSL